MLFYAILLFTGGQAEVDYNDPYYMDFNLVTIFSGFLKYVSMYFNIFRSSLSFDYYSFWDYCSVIVFCFLVIYSVLMALLQKKLYLLVSFILLIGSIVVVLPMRNMQHRLYLYIPSIFFSVYLTLIVKSIVDMLAEKGNKRNILQKICFLIILICSLSYWSPGVYNFRQWWLTVADIDKKHISIYRNWKMFHIIHVFTSKGRVSNIISLHMVPAMFSSCCIMTRQLQRS